ncbi:hypothetical protein CCHR01_14876 [Colletotrichum chrysophilum]|uniref:Uncharacterized protein n=1 Tax=Colletotrichum chrysophilum TaxID=1836956 RepID=A0AAD9EBW3_9PEZI|nr:hypothetical protein CCHR01_14876 [Colletotrichum chrysophilum]
MSPPLTPDTASQSPCKTSGLNTDCIQPAYRDSHAQPEGLHLRRHELCGVQTIFSLYLSAVSALSSRWWLYVIQMPFCAMSLPSVLRQSAFASFHQPALSCSSSRRFCIAHLMSPQPRSLPVQRPEQRRRRAGTVGPASAGAGAVVAPRARKRRGWNFIVAGCGGLLKV